MSSVFLNSDVPTSAFQSCVCGQSAGVGSNSEAPFLFFLDGSGLLGDLNRNSLKGQGFLFPFVLLSWPCLNYHHLGQRARLIKPVGVQENVVYF